MNKIETELYKFIGDQAIVNKTAKIEATNNCFKILTKYCVDFLIWQQQNGYSRAYELDTWFKRFGNKITNSTDELFQLYLNQLNK